MKKAVCGKHSGLHASDAADAAVERFA